LARAIRELPVAPWRILIRQVVLRTFPARSGVEVVQTGWNRASREVGHLLLAWGE
jgi:hypothetical protein